MAIVIAILVGLVIQVAFTGGFAVREWQEMVRRSIVGLMILFGILGECQAIDIPFITTTFSPDSYVGIESPYLNGPGARGLVFTSGNSGPYKTDQMEIGLGVSGGSIGDTYTFQIALMSNSSSVPSVPAFAIDTISFTTTDVSGALQQFNLTSSHLPNISTYSMTSGTNYSYVIYHSQLNGTLSTNLKLATNSAQGAASTVTYSNGFSNGGFSNSNVVYNGSYAISFGQANVVPEPSSIALAAFSFAVLAMHERKRRSRRFNATSAKL